MADGPEAVFAVVPGEPFGGATVATVKDGI